MDTLTSSQVLARDSASDDEAANWELETQQIARFLYRYGHALDRGDFAAFPEFFTDTGSYAVVTSENLHDQGMALYTDRGREALKERAAYAGGYWLAKARKTTHVVTNTYVQDVSAESGHITAHSSLVLYRLNRAGASVLHVVGEYNDVFVISERGLWFVSHQVVLDGSLLPSDLGSIL